MKTKDNVADLNDSGQKVSTDDGKAYLLIFLTDFLAVFSLLRT